MVSPGSRTSRVGVCPVRGDKMRRTAAYGKQGNPQAGVAQTPERHVFRVEGDVSILKRVVGGHRCGIVPLM